MKPYAFIQFESDSYDGTERVSHIIFKDGFDPEDFYFQEFDYLPNWLEDSFSTGFAGGRIKVTVARRITNEMEEQEETATKRG